MLKNKKTRFPLWEKENGMFDRVEFWMLEEDMRNVLKRKNKQQAFKLIDIIKERVGGSSKCEIYNNAYEFLRTNMKESRKKAVLSFLGNLFVLLLGASLVFLIRNMFSWWLTPLILIFLYLFLYCDDDWRESSGSNLEKWRSYKYMIKLLLVAAADEARKEPEIYQFLKKRKK